MEERGEPIPGSNLFRDFCGICGEPIRVPEEKRHLPQNFCLKCMQNTVRKIVESVQREEEARQAAQQQSPDEPAPDIRANGQGGPSSTEPE